MQKENEEFSPYVQKDVPKELTDIKDRKPFATVQVLLL